MKILINTLTLLLIAIFISFISCDSTIPIYELGNNIPDTDNILDTIVPGTDVMPDTNVIFDVIDTDTIIDDSINIADTTTHSECSQQEACNNMIIEGKLCSGSCIYQEHILKCEGSVFNNLCYLTDPPEEPIYPNVIDGVYITLQSVPPYVKEEDTIDVTLILTNKDKDKKEISYSYKHPENWKIDPQNFEQSGKLIFEPYESKTLRFNATAIKANVLNTYYSPLITFYFNDIIYEIFIWATFNQKEGYLKCADQYYPQTFCMFQDCSGYAIYNYATCCEDIFYPGSTCCNDEDCINGVCIDGKCTFQVPTIFIANTTLIQNNHILVILSDFEEFEEKDLCKDKHDKVKDFLQTDLIEEYYRTIIYRRTKRNDILKFKWKVLAGFKSEKFILDDKYDFQSFRERLQQYLNNLNCGINMEEHDKIIIISPRLDLMGFGGMAFGQGYIGQIIGNNGYLTAHELAHSFGATDLYLDIGGNFQYKLSLMANNLGVYGFPEDKVTWGEIGLGDINQNGIIDLFEFAIFPEKIEIVNLRATLTYKDSLEISFEPVLIEEGRQKQGIFNSYYIELPEYNTAMEVYGTPYIAFDQYSIDLNKIRMTKKVKVRIKTQYRYSDKDFMNRLLTFDNTFDLDVNEKNEP